MLQILDSYKWAIVDEFVKHEFSVEWNVEVVIDGESEGGDWCDTKDELN